LLGLGPALLGRLLGERVANTARNSLRTMWDFGSNRELAARAATRARTRVTGTRRVSRLWLALHDVDDRVARVEVEAGGSEEGGADVSGEE
jgi:hypothetical protein